MTVKGRTITGRRHRVGGKLDPEVHGVRFYPTAPVARHPDSVRAKHAELDGPPGAARRTVTMDYRRYDASGFVLLEIATEGWWRDAVTLDEAQIAFLRDTLIDWFPDE